MVGGPAGSTRFAVVVGGLRLGSVPSAHSFWDSALFITIGAHRVPRRSLAHPIRTRIGSVRAADPRQALR